jgi:hypothetical protein
VTSFVREQHITDNLVSFCLRAENEDLMDPDNFSCVFRPKEWVGVVAQAPHLELETGFTPTGENVQATPMPGLTVTFAGVENSGITTMTTSTSGISPPTGYAIVGVAGQPIYYDITTTAAYSGLINVCISYDETQVVGAEVDLKLMHEVDNLWVDITTSVDTENNKIYGMTTTLSPFIVAGLHVAEGTATFKLENLYKLNLYGNLWLYTGSKLVVKFYDYSSAFESGVVIDSITPPQSVLENENVSHPAQGSLTVRTAVKKAELVLTTENENEVISTIATFTAHRSDQRSRYLAVLRAWAGHPELQSAFRTEVLDILKQWSGAPS